MSSAEVFIGPYAGLLSDKYGRIRTLIVSASIFFIGLSLFGMTGNIWIIFFLLLLAFVGGVMLMMQLLVLVGVIAEGPQKSDIFSTYNTFQDIGSAFGPFLGLSLINAEHLSTIYLFTGSLLYILIIGLCVYLNNIKK